MAHFQHPIGPQRIQRPRRQTHRLLHLCFAHRTQHLKAHLADLFKGVALGGRAVDVLVIVVAQGLAGGGLRRLGNGEGHVRLEGQQTAIQISKGDDLLGRQKAAVLLIQAVLLKPAHMILAAARRFVQGAQRKGGALLGLQVCNAEFHLSSPCFLHPSPTFSGTFRLLYRPGHTARRFALRGTSAPFPHGIGSIVILLYPDKVVK